jgi:hypothetical protein
MVISLVGFKTADCWLAGRALWARPGWGDACLFTAGAITGVNHATRTAAGLCGVERSRPSRLFHMGPEQVAGDNSAPVLTRCSVAEIGSFQPLNLYFYGIFTLNQPLSSPFLRPEKYASPIDWIGEVTWTFCFWWASSCCGA